jgi:hypothetical protein
MVSPENAARACVALTGGAFTAPQAAAAMELYRELKEKGEACVLKKGVRLIFSAQPHPFPFPYTQEQWGVLDHLEENGHFQARNLIKTCWKAGESAYLNVTNPALAGIRRLFTQADARFRA